MKNQRDLFAAWLKDAYAMEKSIEKTLKIHAREAKKYPELQEKIEEHMEATARQGEKLKDLLSDRGEKVSKIKAFSGEVFGTIVGYGTKFAEDKIIKNTLSEISTEAFEIASYKTLIMTAERVGDEEAKDILESILKEEEEMAGWAEENLPMLIEEFFEKEADDDEEAEEEDIEELDEDLEGEESKM